jgi:hypothetical protein
MCLSPLPLGVVGISRVDASVSDNESRSHHGSVVESCTALTSTQSTSKDYKNRRGGETETAKPIFVTVCLSIEKDIEEQQALYSAM